MPRCTADALPAEASSRVRVVGRGHPGRWRWRWCRCRGRGLLWRRSLRLCHRGRRHPARLGRRSAPRRGWYGSTRRWRRRRLQREGAEGAARLHRSQRIQHPRTVRCRRGLPTSVEIGDDPEIAKVSVGVATGARSPTHPGARESRVRLCREVGRRGSRFVQETHGVTPTVLLRIQLAEELGSLHTPDSPH